MATDPPVIPVDQQQRLVLYLRDLVERNLRTLLAAAPIAVLTFLHVDSNALAQLLAPVIVTLVLGLLARKFGSSTTASFLPQAVNVPVEALPVIGELPPSNGAKGTGK